MRRKRGAVGKISGKEGLQFNGKAICFDSEEKALAAILDGRVKKGQTVMMEGVGGGFTWGSALLRF